MAANENDNHPDEKKPLNTTTEYDDPVDEEFNDSKAKFLNGGKNGGEVHVAVGSVEDSSSEISFSGLGKEELMKYADDPFWVKIRIILFALFWIGWILMLVAAIVIIVLAPRCPERPNLKWYETNVVYKMDPKSFKDSGNKDSTVGKGVGDLAGIKANIPYIQSLGANALWISSFFKSGEPLDGEDIVDHTQVNEELGTMGDFDALRKDTKKKGMKMVVDFIPNHTGKKHAWFTKSQNREDDYTEYYIWADGPNNSTPPNNWKTVNGQSAWAYDSTRKQWYYFSDLPAYPDLNLNNPKVLGELDGILRFWLDKGVDGIYVKGLQRLVEKNVTTDEGTTGEFTENQPGNFDLVRRWRKIVDEYSDKPGRERALFGHVFNKNNISNNYTEAGIHIMLTDALIDLQVDGSCDSACLESDIMEATEGDHWKGWMVGNEAVPRFGSRVSDNSLRMVYQVMQLLLPGTPFVYYGDELAMVNGVVPKSAEKDPRTKYSLPSRDAYRTPMLWNNEANAGFCDEGVDPWLPVNADYSENNVQFNSAHLNGFTILESFIALSKLRDSESFQWGKMSIKVDGDIVYFTRKADGFDGFLIAINRGKAASYSFSSVAEMMTLVYNSFNTNVGESFSMTDKHLAFNEGQIYVFKY